ncbi:MAG: ComF family protein [Desulfosarcinaceae bacterium]|jgi:ComF family protein
MTTSPTKGIKAIAAALGRTLFPDKCLLCGSFFAPPAAASHGAEDIFQGVLGSWLCGVCLGDCQAIEAPYCRRCGLPFSGEVATDHLCGECRIHPAAFERARSAGPYAGALKALIRLLKFQGRVGLALPLGRLLMDSFERHWTPERVDLIVPVPLHARRMRRRGYNQAYLLLRHWRRWYQTAHHRPLRCRIERDLLRRIRATAPQTGLDRPARERNLKKAFALTHPQACADRRILLVDDIHTTGATLNACAGVLRDAGARRVEALTLARTV